MFRYRMETKRRKFTNNLFDTTSWVVPKSIGLDATCWVVPIPICLRRSRQHLGQSMLSTSGSCLGNSVLSTSGSCSANSLLSSCGGAWALLGLNKTTLDVFDLFREKERRNHLNCNQTYFPLTAKPLLSRHHTIANYDREREYAE